VSRVVILGCGYVGIELGRRLRSAHEVIGVRRSAAGLEQVEAAGLTGLRADVTDRDSLAGVPDPDAVVFAASAGGRSAERARETYLEGQRTAIEALCGRSDPPDRYVYTSSTGVYGDRDGAVVDESTPIEPTTDRVETLAAAEELALAAPAERGTDGTVVRFAGLYGPGRYRIDRYLDGPVAPGYLNLLHRDDAAGAVAHLLREGLARDELVLAVDDEPVERRLLAEWLADRCGVEPPPEGSRRRPSKRCRNDKLRGLGYEFAYPTFREGYAPALKAR